MDVCQQASDGKKMVGGKKEKEEKITDSEIPV